MNWSEYQESVAFYFRSIGAQAQIEAKVKGVRAVHKVDVLVKLKHFGIDVIWIVECKLWKTSIPKEKVLTLQQIVQVGADRGIIMSESGFQAGAIKSAFSSNITLSSLKELKETSAEDLSKLKLKLISFKLEQLTARYHTFIPCAPFYNTKPVHLVDDLLPSLFTIRIELFKAHNNNFPIHLFKITATNINEFITACEDILDKAEIEIRSVEKKYNKKIIIGIELFESLKVETGKLVDAARCIVANMGDSVKQNDIRIQSVKVMKDIGKLTLNIRTYTNNRSFDCFELIHKIIIDQLYLDLINEDLQEQHVNKTYNNLITAYSKFENVFQPISNPPAPDIPI
jgi:copper chaperone CopZ